MRLRFYIKSLQTEHKFAAVALILIPFNTLLFGTIQPPELYTLSMIGNRFDQRFEFIIWGITTSLLLVFLVSHLYRLGAFREKKALKLLVRSGVYLVITVLVPALRDIWPVLNRIHALFGTLFSLSLIGSLFYFLRYVERYNKKLATVSTLLLFIVITGSLACLLILGNTGIFELFFFVTVSFFLMFLWYFIDKERMKYLH